MKTISISLFLVFQIGNILLAQPPLKQEAIQYIEHHQKRFTDLSDQIWRLAEPSFKDNQSAQLLIEVLENEGFQMEKNLCSIPSMFMATYGKGEPVIALFGEYDADLHASNANVPYRKPLANPAGHGAGHNLLGVGSLAATLAIKKLIDEGKLSCTLKYFGTTAEGGLGGRTYLARDGYFDELDLSVYWHPAPVTAALTHGWDAMVTFDVIFKGEKSHAFEANPSGQNALSAAEKFQEKLKFLRSTSGSEYRINYRMHPYGEGILYTPDSVLIETRLQYADQARLLASFDSLKAYSLKIAQEEQVSVEIRVKRAFHEFVPNHTAMGLVNQNMVSLAPITYTEDEIEFAREILSHLNKPEKDIQHQILPFSPSNDAKKLYGYVSDIGDASWFAPEIYFVSTIIPRGIPMHDWPTTAFTSHPISHKGMLFAAKVMATTLVDYITQEDLQEAIQKEFREKIKHYHYRSLLPPHQLPLPEENSKSN